MYANLQTQLLSLIPFVVILILVILVGGAGMISRLLSLPLYLLFGMRRREQNVMPTLVIEDFQYNPDVKDSQSPVLELVARRRGWLAYHFMRLIGLPTEWKVRVTSQELHIKYSTANGMESFLAPLTEITASDLRVEKPVWSLWTGLVLVTFAILAFIQIVLGTPIPIVNEILDNFSIFTLPPVMIVLVIGALLLVWYWWRTRLLLAFSTMNISDRYGLAFRPKQIGDKRIDHETLLASIHHINHLVIESRFAATE